MYYLKEKEFKFWFSVGEGDDDDPMNFTMFKHKRVLFLRDSQKL